MAKGKVDSENRWEAEYLFTIVSGKAVCLVCGAGVAVFKEYNLRRHYETKHQDKYKDMDRQQKVEELKKTLVAQQTMFIKAKSQSGAAVKASSVVAE